MIQFEFYLNKHKCLILGYENYKNVIYFSLFITNYEEYNFNVYS